MCEATHIAQVPTHQSLSVDFHLGFSTVYFILDCPAPQKAKNKKIASMSLLANQFQEVLE